MIILCFVKVLRRLSDAADFMKLSARPAADSADLEMARKFKPNLMMVDLSLPDMNGMQLTRKIRAELPETTIIIVTMHAKVDYIAEAFQAGAAGYVIKESAAEGLLKGIETVLKGEYFLDSAVSPQVVQTLMKLPRKEAKITDAQYGSLTAREQEVLRLLAEGLSSQAILRKSFSSAPKPWKIIAPTS